MQHRDLIKNNQGQGLVEYILLLSIIVSIYASFAIGMKKTGLGQKIVDWIVGDFKSLYQCGDPTYLALAGNGSTCGKFTPIQQNRMVIASPH